jgi:hypothetical protein
MLLHGIAPSIPRWKALGRRFAGFHFPLHSVLHPNEPPIIYSHQMKPYLMSFVGQRSSSVRSRILRHKWSDRVYVADTTNAYSHFSSENHEHPVKSRMRADYWTTLQASAFSLCPRGHGASALRIYEAMRAGVVPIILSDSWVPPVGIDWSQCSIRIKESDYYRAELIAARHLSRASQMGQAAQDVWKQNFSPEKFSYRLKLSIDYLRTHQISDESVCQVFTPAFTILELAHRIRIQSTVALKQLVVRALALR